MSKTLTLLLMDPPFESANTTTALRLIAAALRKGHTVNVFAYEGAVNLTMKGQQQHANPAHGKTVEEEHHPLARDLVAGLFAAGQGERLRWINCGMCVDERGAGDWIDGPRRGSPADFWKWVDTSDQTLVIPCR
jgi:tRNA 2-thiouridine synthesizing protein D